MLMPLRTLLEYGSLGEASKKDLEKLQPNSVAKQAAKKEIQQKKADKIDDPEKEAKFRDKASRERREKTRERTKKDREQSKKRQAKADFEKKQADLKRQRAIRKSREDQKKKKSKEVKKAKEKAKEKKRFRRGGPARTPTGDKKVDKVNAQLAHCMLALKHKRGKSAKAAWNICRWSLTRHGYLKPPYKEGGKIKDGAAKPTQKGVRRAMQHAREKHPLGGGIKGSPHEKYQKFKKMFKSIEKKV